ncbi:hypothetical protein J1N35_001711 [Gossypium stocksii]|uniref:Uncharacterized protein n=1 Tax=Gossypium stocksii TaxID=47602 RepID=A0A9D3WKV6_9ROSI|nr:hypothetical protein J1N35_001711 [Gossypium stocksii]
MTWLKGFAYSLHDYKFHLLHVPSMMLVIKFSSQIEMVRENFAFDLRNYYSMISFKGFELWNLVFQDYNFQMLCDSGLMPSMKVSIHHEKVWPNHVFDSGIVSFAKFLYVISGNSADLIISSAANLFHFCVGDNLKWYPSKKGGYANNLLPLRTIGNDFFRFMNKGVRDDEKFFVSKWPYLRTNHLKEGGYDAIPRVA